MAFWKSKYRAAENRNIKSISMTNSSGVSSAMKSMSGNDEFYELEVGQVVDIILSAQHPNYVEYDNGGNNIGSIRVRLLQSDINKDGKDLLLVRPINISIKQYPLIGELVVVSNQAGIWVYNSIINYSNLINNNSTNILSDSRKNKIQDDTSIDTKINRSINVPLGKYFKKLFSKLLLPNEGDIIIQGRTDSSIRISNGDKNSYNPNIKVTVGFDKENKESTIIENINKDANSIWLTTNEELKIKPPTGLTIQPKSLRQKINFIGNTISVSSDRLIFISKKNEILFYGNKSICLTSNEDITLDAEKSILMSGKEIKLGNDNLEHMVLGEKLVSVLEEIIDGLEMIQYYPSLIPGTNIKLKTLKTQLKQKILSKKNWTQ